jgi:hypothetical protein
MRQMLNKETASLQNGCTVSAVALVESPKYHKLFAMTDWASICSRTLTGRRRSSTTPSR